MLVNACAPGWRPPLVLGLLVSGCTTVGTHDLASLEEISFGASEELRICVLADDGVTEGDSARLTSAIGEELAAYGIEITVPWVRRWTRSAFFAKGIGEAVWQQRLESPCDRLLALVGRNAGDALWGLIGTEILGAVETVTHTRGYVVAQTASFNQLLNPPLRVAVHESYHLLGCEHGLSLAKCYDKISEMKRLARANRERGNAFFPSVAWNGEIIYSQHHANRLIEAAFEAARAQEARDALQLPH